MKKVLIIDDDLRNIFALTATLKARAFTCLSCQSAKEALEILNSTTDVEVVLIDMMMPDIDGYDAIPLIRKIPHMRARPIIAVTAQAMVGDREKCLNAGADAYVSKPINVDSLLELLNKL